ncbi:MAG: cytidine deaminase [Candidatus Hydrothermota bacterium]|nr:MAG: cytidine deaminase [Candidatus Hydrothermae bacterium]
MESRQNIEELVDRLLPAAQEAQRRAYAPYSEFHVGAALLTDGGKVFAGCNVENASYGLTVCAERVAAFKAVCEGERVFRAILLVSDSEEPVPPCGACLQVLAEFSGEDMTVISIGNGGEKAVYSLRELMPRAFKFR